jgi:hypothetical protein
MDYFIGKTPTPSRCSLHFKGSWWQRKLNVHGLILTATVARVVQRVKRSYAGLIHIEDLSLQDF